MSNKVNDFFEFLNKATSPFQTVIECERRLNKAGFQKLKMEEFWSLEGDRKYYVIPYDSMIVAFTVSKNTHDVDKYKIIGSHLDTPGFKIKPKPELNENKYLKLNTEVYEKPILNTWLDRLLSFSGKVTLKSDDVLKPRVEFIDYKKGMLTIPNIAIHLNNKVNSGVELNKQKDMLPIIGQLNDSVSKDDFLINLLAAELNVKPNDILDFDLFIYINEEPALIGLDQSMISAPRIDDLAMVYASMEAIMEASIDTGINIAIAYDNEEVGSLTKQGAASNFLETLLKRIYEACDKIEYQYYKLPWHSMVISADGTHAVHPNAKEKSDIVNFPIINGGITIKYSSIKSYGTDSETAAIFKQLCEKAGVEVQTYANRSDIPGGKTIGSIIESKVGIKTVDVGVPMLAMHSAREVMGVKDLEDSLKVFKTFYEL